MEAETSGCVPPASGVKVRAVEFPVGFRSVMTSLAAKIPTAGILLLRILVDLNWIPCTQRGYRRWRSKHAGKALTRPVMSIPIPAIRPFAQVIAHDDRWSPIKHHKDPVRQVRPPNIVQSSAVAAPRYPLPVKLAINLLRGRDAHIEADGPGFAVCVVAPSPALRAGTMSGCEGDCLVVEKQIRVAVRLPLLSPSSSELERTRDPEIAGVKTNDVSAAMEDTPVARPRTSKRDSYDIPPRGNAIARRRHFIVHRPRRLSLQATLP